MKEDRMDNQWHLSKSVPLALIVAIFMQTLGAVWWASSITEQVEDVVIQLRDNDEENLRQWGRINRVEDKVDIALSTQRTTTAILERLEAQVKENNKLLKEYLRGTNQP